MVAVGHTWRRTRTAAAAAALILVAGVAGAQQPARTEYEIKAAYLFTFGRFVEWPAARSGSDFSICVLGADPFGAVLDAIIEGQTLRGRRVVARRVATPRDGAACHILFISASEEPRLDAIVVTLGRAGVLTVSDMPRFVGRGGMIEFQTAGNRVRFQIDLAPATNAGLTMSSELLRVATAVRRDGRRGD